MEVERQTVQQNPEVGSVETVHTVEHVASPAMASEINAYRAGSYIWYIVGIIETLLLLRFLFLLFGANYTGFSAFLYQITHPFISVFQGIFPTPGNTTGYFDTASLLAMIIYALIGWGIVSLIYISKRGGAA